MLRFDKATLFSPLPKSILSVIILIHEILIHEV